MSRTLRMSELGIGPRIKLVDDVKLIGSDSNFYAEFDPTDIELVNISRYIMCVLFECQIKFYYYSHVYEAFKPHGF